MEQDMEYTKQVKKIYPTGIKAGRWIVNSVSCPNLNSNRIFLRGDFKRDYNKLVICQQCKDVDETLRQILHAIKKWATILDTDTDPCEHKASQCFCVSY